MLSACLLQGEKYLVLKKKYRQMLQERDGSHPRADVDAQRRPSPPWDVADAPAVSSDTQVNSTRQQRSEIQKSVKAPSALQPALTLRLATFSSLFPHFIRVSAATLQPTEVTRHKHLHKNTEQHKSSASSYLRKGKVIRIYLKVKANV